MATNFYYIYALKDPTVNPVKPFYIGKGTGSRAYDHLIRPDNTRKYKKILQIKNSGGEVIIDILADDLTESQAIKLESELISAFGTLDSGGFLTNSVIPTGLNGKEKIKANTPAGSIEKAQLGLGFLKNAILNLIECNKQGLTNSDIAAALGLRSDYEGRQKDYLSYSIIGLLLREKKIKHVKVGNNKKYFINS